MTAPSTSFSPADLVRAADPYALLSETLAEGRVLRSGTTWLVLGHRECLEVLRSGSARSGFIAEIYRSVLPPGAAREEMGHRINFLDPPDHTRVRRLVAKAFTPRRVSGLRPFVAELCRTLLEPLGNEEIVDLIPRFTHPVPSLVISELLGVPPEDRDRLTHLADRVSALLGFAGIEAAKRDDAVAAAEEMHAYLRALLEERRRQPKDDLLSALLAVDDHEKLRESELLSLAATLYSAGHRTTRDLFTNGLATLLPRRDLVASIRAGSLPSAAVVEEFLRFETPTHYVARRLEEPLPVGGIVIPPGEPIVVLLAAANRDPEAYADADRFEPRRWLAAPPPASPLSFAFGPHFCLGASLARMEAQTMLETLLHEMPDAILAPDPLRWRHTGLFRSLEALPVRPHGPAGAADARSPS